MRHITAKLSNMRKPQDFIVWRTDKGRYIIQSDKSIGWFGDDSKGMLNTKGSYFPHLSPTLGAKPYTFPPTFVIDCIAACTQQGDLIGASPITGPVYFGSCKEIKKEVNHGS